MNHVAGVKSPQVEVLVNLSGGTHEAPTRFPGTRRLASRVRRQLIWRTICVRLIDRVTRNLLSLSFLFSLFFFYPLANFHFQFVAREP